MRETEPQTKNPVRQTGWTRTDSLRVARVMISAILLGVILRVMAVTAPVTPVAARESQTDTKTPLVQPADTDSKELVRSEKAP